MMSILISLFESSLRRHALAPLRRFILPTLAFGLIYAATVQAQVGSSISSDGTAPNLNAMLDVQSPATGDGKGILIPRVTQVQRTTASAALAGGLLDNSGNLRGGAAQGLIVYQTDGAPGLYVNTNATATPAWVYLGDVTGLLASNVWASANSTTNYLARTGGTMSGALNMGAQIVSNVAHIDFNGNYVSVGRGANGSAYGAAVGNAANGYNSGAALGRSANGSESGAAVGRSADGYFIGAAVGYNATGVYYGAAMGALAKGTNFGAALGYLADGSDYGTAAGREANGTSYGTAVGNLANGSDNGAAMGREANGSVTGVAVGVSANGFDNGAALGRGANGSSFGAAVGYLATGTTYGAAVGRAANGSSYGAAVGNIANGSASGVAMGSSANGYFTGTALGTLAKGTNYGAAVGNAANGSDYGAAVGRDANGYYFGATVGYAANGYNHGIAVGREADGYDRGAAVGAYANGARTNVAIGARANAQGGTQRIAIGNNVTNELDNTAAMRGHIYMDGGTGLFYRATFGDGSWTAKAFEIDHPLDPENKILRHFCLESPQVWNVYVGNVQLVNGQAVVELPDYYSVLNLVGSEIYSLTVVGALAQIAVGAEVNENQFTIIGDKDVKVSWTIKVLRNDPGCREDLKRRPVEQLKSEMSNSRTAEQGISNND